MSTRARRGGALERGRGGHSAPTKSQARVQARGPEPPHDRRWCSAQPRSTNCTKRVNVWPPEVTVHGTRSRLPCPGAYAMPINPWPWTKAIAPTATNSKEPTPGQTAVPETAFGLFSGSADAFDAPRVAPAMTAHPIERTVRSLIRLPSFIGRYEQPEGTPPESTVQEARVTRSGRGAGLRCAAVCGVRRRLLHGHQATA
jgi:hypothetical protein